MKKTLAWMISLSALFFFIGREEGYVQGVLDAAVEHMLTDNHAASCVPESFDQHQHRTTPVSSTSL